MISAALLLVASMPIAQAGEVNVPKEALAEFEYLVGDWTYSGADGDEAVKGLFSARWAPGKHALSIEMSWTDPSHTSKGTGVDGWDGADNKIVTLEFWDDGWSHYRRYTVKSPGVWHSDEWRGVTADGKQVTGRGIVERKGPDTFVWRTEQRVIDGDVAPNVAITFTRVKS
jgi:hypothetical protein